MYRTAKTGNLPLSRRRLMAPSYSVLLKSQATSPTRSRFCFRIHRCHKMLSKPSKIT